MLDICNFHLHPNSLMHVEQLKSRKWQETHEINVIHCCPTRFFPEVMQPSASLSTTNHRHQHIQESQRQWEMIEINEMNE